MVLVLLESLRVNWKSLLLHRKFAFILMVAVLSKLPPGGLLLKSMVLSKFALVLTLGLGLVIISVKLRLYYLLLPSIPVI
jgi:hypothetical protein